MMKTEMQIERDFYHLVKGSALGAAIRGKVYRSEMRPSNATGEDLIVKFLAGADEQIQHGTVILNLYVPDVFNVDGRKVADKNRIGVLQELINDFIEDCVHTDYLIEADGTPYATKNTDIEQHLIVARLNFKRFTE